MSETPEELGIWEQWVRLRRRADLACMDFAVLEHEQAKGRKVKGLAAAAALSDQLEQEMDDFVLRLMTPHEIEESAAKAVLHNLHEGIKSADARLRRLHAEADQITHTEAKP